MNEKSWRSPSIRVLRSRLIRDGNSEEDVDEILAELQTEFTAISEQEATLRRPFFLERLARKLASRRLGEGADPQDLDRLTKRYEQWLIPLSIAAPDLLPRAAEGIATIIASLSSEAEPPVATAPLPFMDASAAKGQWYLPTDDPKPTMHCTDHGILFGVRPNTSVNAVEDGVVAEVLDEQQIKYIQNGMPFFWIELHHADNVQTFYTGIGKPLVAKHVSVKAQGKIAVLSQPNLFFQAGHWGSLWDGRGYSSFFPRVPWNPLPKGSLSLLQVLGSYQWRAADIGRKRLTRPRQQRRQR